MKVINKILFFVSIIAIYFIAKELMLLYVWSKTVHPLFSYFIFFAILSFFFYFIFLPIIKIYNLPRFKGPAKNKSNEDNLISDRLEKFSKNKFLINSNYNFSTISVDKEGYEKIITAFKKESEQIKKKYVSQLLISSSVSQNGFLDAILILSASLNLIKEIFKLYDGRVSNRNILIIIKKIYFSVAIGGSELVEIASEEVLTKLSAGLIKNIPFLNIVAGSLADGFVNAFMLTRIFYITENYCTMTYIESDKDLKPPSKVVISDVTNIAKSLLSQKSKSVNYKYCINCGKPSKPENKKCSCGCSSFSDEIINDN